MFERFTDNARKSMALANMEAQRLGQDHIGLNHVLLGLTKNEQCCAYAMLARCGVDIPRLRARLESLDPPRKSGLVIPAKLPQLTHAKRAIEYAIAEARDR